MISLSHARTMLVMVLSISMLAACCQVNDPILPSSDVQELVTRSCHAWLNARMLDADWEIFNASNAAWKTAQTVDEVIVWFQESMEPPDLWEFDQFLSDISQSELYKQNPPDAFQLMEFIRQAFASFEYISEEE